MTALPLRTRLLYSVSSLGGEALNQSRTMWLLFYYAPPEDADRTALVNVGVMGLLLTASKFLEAFDDALIGYWSDRTRSRLGRRLPFILLASPLWVLFFFLLFNPPANASAAMVAIYFFVMFELYSLFSTLGGGPYEALLPEIATTSRDRVAVVGTKVYFGVAGAAVGLVASPILVDHVGFQGMALVMALLALTMRYTGMFGVWNRASRDQAPAELSFRQAMRATFSNVNFLRFLPTFVLFQAGLAMLIGLLPYYVHAVLGREEGSIWVSVLTAVAIGAMVVAVPFFARLADRTSKSHAFSVAMFASALTFPLLFFAGFLPGIPKEAQVIVAMLLAGAPLAGVYLFPAAITADICDDDAARTGMRREATYFGAQNFVEKTAGSLAPALLGLVLLLGNTAADPIGVRLVGPIAGLLVFAGYLIFRNYDLPDEVRGEVPMSDVRVPGEEAVSDQRSAVGDREARPAVTSVINRLPADS